MKNKQNTTSELVVSKDETIVSKDLDFETSELNKWLYENEGRKKILVMHHPIEHLSSFAQKELKSMLNNGIDILINGHIHDQEIITLHTEYFCRLLRFTAWIANIPCFVAPERFSRGPGLSASAL